MTRSFSSTYAAMLAAYVADRTERRLEAAYELSRVAVEQGLGVLDVAEAHTDAVRRIAHEATDVVTLIEASGDFLIESLAAFEIVQRGATEAWRAAWEERRRARMVRELSAVLADADIASAAGDSAHELAQLVAETLREMTGAAEATVSFESPGSNERVCATALEPEGETWSEFLQAAPRPRSDEDIRRELTTVPIRSIDGMQYGRIEIARPAGAQLRADDRAMVRQVADLAAAWLDRTHPTQRF